MRKSAPGAFVRPWDEVLKLSKAMPEKSTLQRARRDAAQGKSASTQAGEFVREQIHHIREGRHGARSAKQAIAIGLSEARRAGVKLPAPRRASKSVREKAAHDTELGRHPGRRVSRRRSEATLSALRREPRSAASSAALARQTQAAARRRSPEERSAAAHRAAETRRHEEE
jgi:hypothetical protein